VNLIVEGETVDVMRLVAALVMPLAMLWAVVALARRVRMDRGGHCHMRCCGGGRLLVDGRRRHCWWKVGPFVSSIVDAAW
jgi:hypothetical protein